jgi:hypothetical protein
MSVQKNWATRKGREDGDGNVARPTNKDEGCLELILWQFYWYCYKCSHFDSLLEMTFKSIERAMNQHVEH